MPNPTWLDRTARYRIAAAFLYVPFLGTLIGQIFGVSLRDVIGLVGVRSFYYTGLLLLTVALAMDAWEVYAGKRRVKQLINQRINERRPPGRHSKDAG
jgi:hypothetical protein